MPRPQTNSKTIGSAEFDRAFLLYRELHANYNICPFCGSPVDLSGIDLLENGKYPYCSCFENSSDWQYRMQARNGRHPLQVLGTYTFESAQQVISLAITLEDIGYTHQVWQAYLKVNPTAATTDELLITLETHWPPTKEVADLLVLLTHHQRFLDETMSRLRENTYRVNSTEVPGIERIVKLLETQFKQLERK